jgi:hypothetical protein
MPDQSLLSMLAGEGDEPPFDSPSILASRILADRPDVLNAYYDAYCVQGGNKAGAAWTARVGGATAEDYALHWYDAHGRFEGYNQGPTTAALNVSVQQILDERPDVLAAFNDSMRHGRHSTAWVEIVGGDRPEAYAKYWYENHGRWEGYAQTPQAAADNVDIPRLLADRPDVTAAYYAAYYGPNNDRHSSAWADRIGGETLQDYARYWYVNHGRQEGYTQNPAALAAPPDEPQEEAAAYIDPALEPWNHPALFPDYDPALRPAAAETAQADVAPVVTVVGQSLSDIDLT